VPGKDDKASESKQPGSKKGGESPPESAWTGLLKSAVGQLIPIVLTGASLIGFVAFAGAVIVWTRFYAIEVPQDQAVKAVPQSELVATGSSVLLLFGFFGVLAIVATYLVDRSGRATPGMSRALLVLLMIEGIAAILIFDGSWDSKTVIAIVLFAACVLVALLATFHESVARYVDELPSRENETRDPYRGAGPLRTPTNQRRASPGELWSLAASTAAVLAFALVLIFMPHDQRLGATLAVAAILVVVIPLLKPWRPAGEIAKGLSEEWHERNTSEENEQGKQERRRRDREKAERQRVETCGETTDPPAPPKATTLERACDCAARLLAAARGKKFEKPAPKSRVELEREREAACAKEREELRRARRRPHRLRITGFGIIVLMALGAVATGASCWVIGSWWLAIPLSAAMVLGIGVWRIAVLPKPTFMWFGLAVFLSVPLFGTLTLMAHNISNPQVQPVALIRSSDGPDEAIQGIYVTEGSDRVYFANVATEGCSDKVQAHSGRLLWVPKSEVVAMSVGPLQGVEDAGRSALEMAYALTPSVETPAAGALSLTPPEEESEKLKEAEEKRLAKELETHAPQLDQRLENPGPAVRPDFGSGLNLVPEVASPGRTVELRMSKPNAHVNGFGAAPNGHTLRLNGVPLTILRERSQHAGDAEYVKTAEKTVLGLDKAGVYGLGLKHERPYLLQDNATYERERFVKLAPGSVAVEGSGGLANHPQYLRIELSGPENPTWKGAKLAGEPRVKTSGGPAVALQEYLLRQAWSNNAIRFRVPEAASSGVVTLDCGQLAGSPLLRVSHAPTARIAVRMHENSASMKLDSGRSRDGDGEKILRSWTIEGLGRGHRQRIAARFPPRLGAYLVKLTVTDEAGNSDTAELRLLRLPASLMNLKGHPRHRAEIKQAAKALDEAVQARPPAAIELDGHTDRPGSPAMNMKLAFESDDRVDEDLLLTQAKPPAGELPIPVRELAYGKTCPIDPRSGSRPSNRRVDVFVLDEGVTVKPPHNCVPGRLRNTKWYPRPSTEPKALSGGIAPPRP
jgi:flagellar motor protein MotB